MSGLARKAILEPGKRDLSLSRQCQILSLSRSSAYYRPKGESAETLALMRRIDELFMAYPFYGSRQMQAALALEGLSAGRHRVRRLMSLMGLQAIYQRPNTSKPHPEHRVYSYKLRGLSISRPNHVLHGYHLYPDAMRLSISRGDYGLGHAAGTVLAVVQYAGHKLLFGGFR